MNLEQALSQPAFDPRTVLHRSNRPTTRDAVISYPRFHPVPHTLDVTNHRFMWFYRYHAAPAFPPQLRFEFKEKDLLREGLDRVVLWVISCLKNLGRQRPDISYDERRQGKFRQDHPPPHLVVDFQFTHTIRDGPFVDETAFAVVQVKSVGSLRRDFWNGQEDPRNTDILMTREVIALSRQFHVKVVMLFDGLTLVQCLFYTPGDSPTVRVFADEPENGYASIRSGLLFGACHGLNVTVATLWI